MATSQLCAIIDDLLGPGRWQRPAHWGRPLVTFPDPDTAWEAPTSGWRLDSQDLELTMLVVFAHLAPVRPGGGGTLVITGSYRLTIPSGSQAGNTPVRSRKVKTHLSTMHPWLRDLWNGDCDTDRIHRYLTAGHRRRSRPGRGAHRRAGRCGYHAPQAAACGGTQQPPCSADDALAVPPPAAITRPEVRASLTAAAAGPGLCDPRTGTRQISVS